MLSDVASIGFSANRVIAAFANPALRSTRAVSPVVESEASAPAERAGETRPTESTAPAEPVGKSELTDEEQREVEELQRRAEDVRRHEQAHKNAAGQYARGGPTYEYTQGPDGKRYVSGGEVQIDLSEVPGDPEATIRKMQQVRRAALAPADPSSKDRQVAAKASAAEAQARTELAGQRAEEGDAPSASREPTAPATDRSEPADRAVRGESSGRTDPQQAPPETVIFPREDGPVGPASSEQSGQTTIEPPAPSGEPFGVAPRVNELSPDAANLAPDPSAAPSGGVAIASHLARLDAGLVTLNANPAGRFIDVVV